MTFFISFVVFQTAVTSPTSIQCTRSSDETTNLIRASGALDAYDSSRTEREEVCAHRTLPPMTKEAGEARTG